MNRILVIFILLVSYCTAYSQQFDTAAADSLNHLLKEHVKDTKQIDILNALAWLHYNTDLKKCVSYGERALELATHGNYEQGEERALSILNRAHRRLGNFSVALELNLRQINIDERQKDTLHLIDAYTSLGNIYSATKNLNEAKTYLRKAYLLGTKKNINNLSSIINFWGRIYTQNGEYDSAIYWINKAFDLERESPVNNYTISYIYNNLAEVYHYKKDYPLAIKYFTASMNLPEARKSPFGMAFTLNGLAAVYLDLGDFNKAKEMANASIRLSDNYAYRDKAREAYRLLYQVHEKTGDYKKALTYYQQFKACEDSIFSEDKQQYIENLKIYFETERVAQENEILRKDTEIKDVSIQKGRYFAMIALVSALALAGILLFLYQNYRQKKNTNEMLSQYNRTLEEQVDLRTKELVKTNMELIKQNNQLEQFGYITAHNLRAPVARILGLANIINNKHFSMPSDKEVLDKLQFAALELDTIIYDLNVILDIKKGIQYSYEEIDLNQRFEKIKGILKDKIKASNVTVEADFSKVKTCYGIPAYLESILYNLLSNAIKYRSIERVPVVKVSSELVENKIKLTIRDNGIGINLLKTKEKIFNLYQRFHDHVEGKGIGLFLVKTQVEAMNGSVEIESNEGQGTAFHIFIPLKKSNTHGLQ